MNPKAVLIILFFVLVSSASAITVENNKFVITCLPDEAPIQSNGFTQDCWYTNKANSQVEIEVLYCLDTKLYDGEIVFDENIINETQGGFLGIGKKREVVGKVKQEKKFKSDVIVTEEDKVVEYYENVKLPNGKVKKDKDGKDVKEKKIKIEKVKKYEVVDSDNFVNVKNVPTSKKVDSDSLKPECYSAGNMTIESDESRKVVYNYNPVDLDKTKWDTYIMQDGEIVYGLDPQFNAELYEIGGNRSIYYYWYNGTDVNVDIQSYTPTMSISTTEISNFPNRVYNTTLESKEITLKNFISNIRFNTTFYGNVSVNVSVDNGSNWLFLNSEELLNTSKIYNLTNGSSSNNVLKYFINLNPFLTSDLLIDNQEVNYTYFVNSSLPPNVTDWRANGSSLASINLGFDLNESTNFTDYSTNNYLVVAGG